MTVEASIVLPLILFFFMNLASSIEMIRLHGNLQLALWETGNELIVYGYALDSGTLPDEAQGGEIQIDREQVDGIQFEEEQLRGEQSDKAQEEKWWKRLSGTIISSVFVKAQLVQLLGEDYLNDSPLKSGTDSLMLWAGEGGSLCGGERAGLSSGPKLYAPAVVHKKDRSRRTACRQKQLW